MDELHIETCPSSVIQLKCYPPFCCLCIIKGGVLKGCQGGGQGGGVASEIAWAANISGEITCLAVSCEIGICANSAHARRWALMYTQREWLVLNPSQVKRTLKGLMMRETMC